MGYEAYIKLLPPLGIDTAIPLADYAADCRTVADLNKRAAFWDAHGIRLGAPTPERLQPITYREVAKIFGLIYDEKMSGEAIRLAYGVWPPNLGVNELLTQSFVARLIQITGPTTATYFHGSVDEGNYHFDEEGFPQDWLEQGVAADLSEVVHRDNAFPIYTFAANHSWCLYQAEYNDWLEIGCSNNMADKLFADHKLEAFLLR